MIGVSETVQKFILDYIRTRAKPGEKLPSEREIAKMLEVGRSSVREALQTLTERGIIEKRPGKGNYLIDRSTDQHAFDIRNLLPAFDVESSLDLLEFRRCIETENAYLAARRRTKETLMILEEAVDELKTCVERQTSIIVPDLKFHNAIAHATQNKIIISVYDSLISFSKKVRIEMAINDDTEHALFYHTSIFEAIKNEDEEKSGNLMRRHIEDVQLHYKKMLSEITPLESQSKQVTIEE